MEMIEWLRGKAWSHGFMQLIRLTALNIGFFFSKSCRLLGVKAHQQLTFSVNVVFDRWRS